MTPGNEGRPPLCRSRRRRKGLALLACSGGAGVCELSKRLLDQIVGEWLVGAQVNPVVRLWDLLSGLTGKSTLAYTSGMSNIFDALAAPARRAILDELHERNGQTLFELCARLTMKHGFGLSRQAISQHLDVLESVGLITTSRQGRYKYHYLDTLPLEKLIGRWSQPKLEGSYTMRIYVTSVYVDDQEKALKFYTEILGFVKKNDMPVGGGYRWLTVVSPHDPNGTELLLEPDAHPAAKPFKEALVADGIPLTSFAVADVHAEFERLRSLGVRFTQEPAEMGQITLAVLDDTCGNLIQIIKLPE